MFFSQRIHDKCYRRPHFDAGQFVESWDDEGARKGYCLYKLGCKGPTTYNACSTIGWNENVSFPIRSGHGCIGCSEDKFWDKGPFYDRLSNVQGFGVEANADQIGLIAAAGAAGMAAAHAAVGVGRDVVRGIAEKLADRAEHNNLSLFASPPDSVASVSFPASSPDRKVRK
jgi:hydrogenase small subunit